MAATLSFVWQGVLRGARCRRESTASRSTSTTSEADAGECTGLIWCASNLIVFDRVIDCQDLKHYEATSKMLIKALQLPMVRRYTHLCICLLPRGAFVAYCNRSLGYPRLHIVIHLTLQILVKRRNQPRLLPIFRIERAL